MKYRPEIDGLRTIAVVPVILFHAGFSWFSGGFVGVDVFFVISGYLITTILLTDMNAGQYSLWRFYERRARRILPALFVVMMACLPFAWAFMLQTQLRDFFESLAVTALFSSNFLFWSESGYFAAVAEEKPLLHTWSLAVEEQYYLLFPPMLWAAMKAGYKSALAMISICLGISLSFAIFADITPEARFFLSHTRVWELLVGSLCAWVLLYRDVHKSQTLANLGLALIFAAIFGFDHTTPYPLFASLPVAGTMLIILFAPPNGFASYLLSLRIMVGIGLISFSAYLWHQPLFAFARILHIGAPPQWMMAALAILSIGLAWVSWRFVEQPFRGAPAKLLPRQIPLLSAAVIGMFSFVAIGWYGHEKEGFPDRPVVRNLTEPMIDARFERFRTWDVLDGVVPARFDLAKFSDRPETQKLLLLGDSHSKGLFNALYANYPLFTDIEVRRVALNFNCFADPKAKDCMAELISQAPDLFHRATHVAIAARWHRPGRLAALNSVPQAMRARGIAPLLIGMTAEYETEGPVLIADIARDVRFDGTDAFPVDVANAEFFQRLSPLALETNANMRALANRLDLPFFDRIALVCPADAQKCFGVTPNAKAVTYDYGHWTLAGSKFFGQRIAQTGWLILPPPLR